ncbi:MAG: IS110 family transposase [Deltaproteobacteria bacterium]|nr:IS110 family transposase [Deltaproteobacteria bacterium]
MGGQADYVGVDVSKARLDIAVRPSGELFSEANDKRAMGGLVKRLKVLHCTRIVVEATGGYETLMVAALCAAGLPVVVVNPRWVRDFAKGIGWLEKTDHIDAKLLALYAERAELKVQQLPDEATRQLRELCARRMDLLEMIDAERNRLEHATSAVRREITGHIDYLRKRLKRIEREIDGAVRSSELWRHQNQLMDSVPGVGPTLRASALAWLPELGQLNRKAAGKLVGIAPLPDDSGKTRGYRRIAGGRGPLRKVLFMATMGAMLHNPHLRAYYDRLRARGKQHKVALVATMRKLLLILNAIIKTNTPWSESCLTNL